ncbi:GNAT family N-acetyltransferase [Maritalea sp.]|jgi:ribosomal protein S18 acetylase RimI-like enzyme|uniref:GNAT family N-acetyltransferase n=1 Tax=Maritalea sp. TaxID=2003361 RepID=UPI0039E38D79
MSLIEREIRTSDLDLICHHRFEMFRDIGAPLSKIEEMIVEFRKWLNPRLHSGEYFGFILEENGKPAGGIGLSIIDWAPHVLHPKEHLRGYISNVYVEHHCRRQGIASRLMELGEAELKGRGATLVVLHASDAGREIYDKSGWKQSSEMIKHV